MGKRSYWIGLLLSLFFLFLFFRKIDLRGVWESFKSVEYVYTLPLMAINLLAIWVRAKRWDYLLSPIKRVPMKELYNATAIGFMANNIFPARVGEFVRAIILGHRARISKTASFATIVVERFYGPVPFFIGDLFYGLPPGARLPFQSGDSQECRFINFCLLFPGPGHFVVTPFSEPEDLPNYFLFFTNAPRKGLPKNHPKN
jgi:hypothetical protein